MTTILPRHVAIIPDGNRRWARQQGKGAGFGHAKGVPVMREIASYAAEQGVEYVSVWGLSLSNLIKRSKVEVATLLRLFQKEFTRLQTDPIIHEQHIKIQVLGKWREKFPRVVSRAIEGAQTSTAHYSKRTLSFFLAYNGTADMLDAVQALVSEKGEQRTKKITADDIKKHLLTKQLPPVDLLIRTGGEPHLSTGFMMWDIADAALFFTPTYWPAFTSADFDTALKQYASQTKREGA